MDPSSATGYAPAEMLLGRQLVYPIEFKRKSIDFEGVEMTEPLVQKLLAIHNETFGIAAEKNRKVSGSVQEEIRQEKYGQENFSEGM